MRNLSWRVRIRIILAACFLIMIYALCLGNLPIVTEAFNSLLSGQKSFEAMTQDVSAGYSSRSFHEKNGFVNLNGLFAKATGRRVYHGVARLEGNTLTYDTLPYHDMANWSSAISGLSKRLEKDNIPFLYIQAPYKVDLAGTNNPDGVENNGNLNADELLSGLQQNGINTLDLRTELSASPQQVIKNFYGTDHHWNSDAAFSAFHLVMSWIKENQIPELDITYTDKSLWEHHVIPHQSLGSHGKRVGVYYAGTDEAEWYTPLFTTKMSCSIPSSRQYSSGDFSTSDLRLSYAKEKNYFGPPVYNLFLGGDFDLVQHRNSLAPNSQKLLIIKDSFMRPMESFLATEFAAVDTIDPRYYSASTIAEYISWAKPDLVLMMAGVSVFGDSHYYKLGTDELPQPGDDENAGKPLVSGAGLTIEPTESRFHHGTVSVELIPGKAYEVTIDRIQLRKGHTDGVSVALFGVKQERMVRYTALDLDYVKAFGPVRWVFRVPADGPTDESYQLQFYSGLHGKTENVGVRYEGITVREVN